MVPGSRERLFDLGRELIFRDAAFEAKLRRDAGDQAGLRVGQEVVGRLAIQHHRLADLVQLGVSADGGELCRTVAPDIGPEGFVVVPEKGVGHGSEKG